MRAEFNPDYYEGNQEIIEKHVAEAVEKIKKAMAKGVPHDKIIVGLMTVVGKRLSKVKNYDDKGTISYLLAMSSHALYHLTNAQIQNRN